MLFFNPPPPPPPPQFGFWKTSVHCDANLNYQAMRWIWQFRPLLPAENRHLFRTSNMTMKNISCAHNHWPTFNTLVITLPNNVSFMQAKNTKMCQKQKSKRLHRKVCQILKVVSPDAMMCVGRQDHFTVGWTHKALHTDSLPVVLYRSINILQ